MPSSDESAAAPPAAPQPPTAAAPGTFFWFAVWTGVCVACIYLCQPLLRTLGREFGVVDNKISLVVTATQVGYGTGIFALVPLGDFFDRRRLVLVKLALLTAAALACAAAPTLPALIAASFLLGVFATTAQDFVPIAAELAPDARRGRYIGYVMTGLMLGILLSRTFAGWIAAGFGWRRAFLAGAGAVALSLASCAALFPPLAPRAGRGSVLAIYASMRDLLRAHRRLRVSLVRHGLLGLAFSGFWTTLAFFLSEAPYRWSPSGIGMMGLAGAAGVVATSVAGRLADARGPLATVRGAAALALGAFAAMWLGRTSAVAIVAGTVVFDLAVQASLVSHQALVYGLDPRARGRINGIFVSAMFLFLSAGSLVGSWLWSRFGWAGVMGCGVACAVGTGLLTARRFAGDVRA